MKRTLTLVAAALALLPAVALGGGTAATAAPAPPADGPLVLVTNFDGNDQVLWKAGGDATRAKGLDKVNGDDACSISMTAAGSYGALRSFNPDATRKTPVQGADVPQPIATWAEAGVPY